jgi:hypothetical protein
MASMAQYTAGRRGRTVPHEQALAVQVRRRLQDLITGVMERIAWRSAMKSEHGVVLRRALLQKMDI